MSDETSPRGHEVIEVRVGELKQFFNSIDPSPFRQRDLDPRAEEFILRWAREVSRDAPLALLVHVDRGDDVHESAETVAAAVHEFFHYRADMARQRLRQLFRIGRTSLAIGLVCLAASIALGDFLGQYLTGSRVGALLREGLLIGGWVAMWRPMEIFLYDWWPIRAESRLYDRLSEMPTRVQGGSEAAGGA